MKWAFLEHLKPPHSRACCGLKHAENPHGMGIVAVWRFEPASPWTTIPPEVAWNRHHVPASFYLLVTG